MNNRRPFPDQDFFSQRRHVTPDRADFGNSAGRIHRPSSGFSHSDAFSFENSEMSNPNVEFFEGENNRSLNRDRRNFFGIGPKGYRRADDRILEDVSEALTRHPEIDASEIDIGVKGGIVTLKGEVETKRMKRLAEQTIEYLPGIADIHNELRVTPFDRDRQRIAKSLA